MTALGQMTGLWLEESQLTLRRDLMPPRPIRGECLARVIRPGIGNTDIEPARGFYPYQGVPGHEFVVGTLWGVTRA